MIFDMAVKHFPGRVHVLIGPKAHPLLFPCSGSCHADIFRRSWICPLLALLILHCCRFKISDNEIWKDDLAAWACIRLDRLQTGYRFVHFMDALGNPSKGVLLVKIEKSLP